MEHAAPVLDSTMEMLREAIKLQQQVKQEQSKRYFYLHIYFFHKYLFFFCTFSHFLVFSVHFVHGDIANLLFR